jgi:uncharacterized membrane protein YphA (DoxX/SURF4 family)
MQTASMNVTTMSPESQIQAKPITTAPIEFHVMREPAQWNLATRIGFRFAFAYLVLYSFPSPLDILPWVSLFTKYNALWTVIVTWAGKHLLGMNITILPYGSGDTTYNYVQILCMLAMAATATVIWSLLDRKRGNYEKLHQWLRMYVRIVLGMTLIGYGADKVIQNQMPAPGLATLMETYGQSSPMHLLWTFMGASRGYNAFAGGAEMLGGVLLFIPAFTAIGALVSIGVMSNVFMLNMCYDVPVKLFSFHLLLMAVFLVTPDLGRLADLFLFHRRLDLYSGPALFSRKWVSRTVVAAQLLLALYLSILCLYQAQSGNKIFDANIGPPLSGAWSVEEYAVDGKVVPPSPTAGDQWQRVFFQNPWAAAVDTESGVRLRLRLKLDEKQHTLKLVDFSDSNWKADFSYQSPQPNGVTLTGQMNGHQAELSLRRLDTPKSFLLTSRGFHWINEHSFNQ